MTTRDHAHEPGRQGAGHGDHAGHGGHGDHAGHGGHAGHGRIERLLSDERARSMPPDATLRLAGVTPGMMVVDLGCGPGFLTIPARHIVGPSGRVIAVDVQPEMLDHLRGRLAAAAIDDVEVILATDEHVPVADGVADVVLCALVLHEVDDPAGFLAGCARLAKRDGIVAVIEIHHEDVPGGPPVAHRISAPAILDLAGRAGLNRHEVVRLNEDRVLVRLGRGAD